MVMLINHNGKVERKAGICKLNTKRIIGALIVVGLALGLVGCTTEKKETSSLSSIEPTVATTSIQETEPTTEVVTDIAPADLIENAKKSLDALDSLETNLYINTEISSKFARYLMDDLGYQLENVPELEDRLDDFFLVKTSNHITIKFDEDTVYMAEHMTEENEFINLISPGDGTVEEKNERYLELTGEQRIFETDGSGWETSIVSDLSNITANPVQTAIEFLNDFKPNSSNNLGLSETIIIEGTILAEAGEFAGNVEADKRVPAKITFDNVNKQLISIEIDMISLYDNDYLYEMLDPHMIEKTEDIIEYIKASKNELIITFSNANDTKVIIPNKVIEKATETEETTEEKTEQSTAT